MIDTKIVNNVLSEDKATLIENTLFSDSFPWYFQRSIGDSNIDFETPGFFHVLKHKENIMSSLFEHIKEIADLAFIKSGYYKLGDFDIITARAFLLIPFRNAKEYDYKHIDTPKDHIVCLYYVNDTDGDTFIFGKNKADGITERVSPRKNKVVLFDGLKYHSSSCPTEKARAVINFNLVLR